MCVLLKKIINKQNDNNLNNFISFVFKVATKLRKIFYKQTFSVFKILFAHKREKAGLD